MTPGPRLKSPCRVQRLAFGNPGDVRPVGDGVSKMRIHSRSGYRVYYVQRGTVLIVPLCGGDKATQGEDIETVKRLGTDAL